MSEEQIQKIVDELKRKTEEIKAHPEKAAEYLMNAGLIDKNGHLTEPYLS